MKYPDAIIQSMERKGNQEVEHVDEYEGDLTGMRDITIIHVIKDLFLQVSEWSGRTDQPYEVETWKHTHQI